MNNPTKNKLPSHLVLTAILSGGITIAFSLIYILICIAALIYRYSVCDTKTGARYFWNTIINVYIQDGQCPGSPNTSITSELTSDFTVFVLTAIILSFSTACLVTAVTLVIIVQDEGSINCINFAVAAYIASCISSLVVDLTTAIHFGMDYTYLTAQFETASTDSSYYQIEVLRQGAFLLMSIALKGYVAPLINLIMLILLVVYVVQHRKLLKSDEHSIHKLGALAAFDQPRKPEDNNWTTQPEIFPTFARGSLVNNGFINDDDFMKLDQPRSDHNNYNSRAYDRSDSWHHTQPDLAQSHRPFSYLEDVKRPVPSRPPPALTAADPSWRRDPWPQTPPVPAPDYSPEPARRLKSALKSAYI